MAALPLTVVHGALLLTWDLAGRIWITVGLLVAAAGALIWAISRLERVAGSPAAAVRAWCRENMASYKVPKYVELVDALPMNASGKVVKPELRERAGQILAS